METNVVTPYVTPDPEFSGLFSSDEIWYAGEIDIRLTDVIDEKANITHTHSNYAPTSHTHNYAGSSSAGGAATSANKLNAGAGSTTRPVYFVNGIPTQIAYSINKTVPSDAVFTDTTYSPATSSVDGLMSASDKTKLDGMVFASISEVETYLGI